MTYVPFDRALAFPLRNGMDPAAYVGRSRPRKGGGRVTQPGPLTPRTDRGSAPEARGATYADWGAVEQMADGVRRGGTTGTRGRIERMAPTMPAVPAESRFDPMAGPARTFFDYSDALFGTGGLAGPRARPNPSPLWRGRLARGVRPSAPSEVVPGRRRRSGAYHLAGRAPLPGSPGYAGTTLGVLTPGGSVPTGFRSSPTPTTSGAQLLTMGGSVPPGIRPPSGPSFPGAPKPTGVPGMPGAWNAPIMAPPQIAWAAFQPQAQVAPSAPPPMQESIPALPAVTSGPPPPEVHAASAPVPQTQAYDLGPTTPVFTATKEERPSLTTGQKVVLGLLAAGLAWGAMQR